MKWSENLIANCISSYGNFYGANSNGMIRSSSAGVRNVTDNNYTTYLQAYTPHTIGFYFNKPICIQKYFISSHTTYSVKDWVLEGSNDSRITNLGQPEKFDGTWELLDSETKTYWNMSQRYEFIITNQKKYKAYRFIFKSSNNSSNPYAIITELGLFKGFKEYKYLLKQNTNYYSIKPEFYNNDNYNPLALKGDTIPNDNDFTIKGFDNLTLLTKTIDSKIINGIEKGRFGSGKYFEVGLDEESKRIKNNAINSNNNVIPKLTSRNSQGIIIADNGGAYGGERVGWKVFAQLNNINDDDNCFDSEGNPPYIIVNLNNFGARCFSKFTITPSRNIHYAPGEIYIYGSNDGSNYTQISHHSFLSRNSYTAGVKKEFNIDAPNIYKYYQFKFTKNSTGGSRIIVAKIEFMETCKYLIRYNSEIYTFNGTNILLLPIQTLDKSNFDNNGFSDATKITEEMWDTAFADKSNVKLLVWTDDMNRTSISMDVNIESFKPKDKLKLIHDGKFDILMK
ncbi:hypothetical protein RBU49_01660 [Clostridium sp. MB40-C1]|uniref:hypothetical protein n=1 Tax=Clostridium sp. MB40-C1 TaxID=3070996 RepID=UPI0027E1B774|nr:hypothetical protein [Clostridium sp. MB40-C1]WMJ80985.1 hypothetical protein RBU49_01660 [Clostridium sp. MB40-C1]